MKDPRINIDGVSEVLISPDGRQAHVRLAMSGSAESQLETIEVLNHAKGFLKAEVGQRLDLFRLPDLHFESAISPELGSRMQQLLKRVRKGRPR